MPDFVDVLYATDNVGLFPHVYTHGLGKTETVLIERQGERRACGSSAAVLVIVQSAEGHQDLWNKLTQRGLLWPKRQR